MDPLRGVRVLVVDDKPDQLEMMCHVLRRAGAHVETALSAQEAFDTFQADPADVLIADVVMPGATGLALIRSVRGIPSGRSVPAIAVSALPWQECRAEAIEAGFSEWVSKPGVDSLVNVVLRLTKRT